MRDRGDETVMDGVRCEGCGYALDGLGRDGVCSECGLAVASSLPRARVGTPWQQGAGLGSLLRTWWLLLTDDDCWREMRIDRASRRLFVGWCRVLGCSVLLLAGIWYTLADSGSSVTLWVFVVLLRFVVTPAVFLVLWLVYGFGLGQAAVVTVLVLIVLSIVQRMLMVPVRMIWG
ncbi:MAG: hypothetical protein CMJ35_08605 [Phycisphaerae bacterium]|nr:hypothetical protein [Phycisphaerae bacterium]